MKKLIFTIVTVLGLSTNLFGVDLNEKSNVHRVETPQSIQCLATGGTPIWVKDTIQSTKNLRVEVFRTCKYNKSEMSNTWSNTWGIINAGMILTGIFFLYVTFFQSGGLKSFVIGVGLISIANSKFVWLNTIGSLIG